MDPMKSLRSADEDEVLEALWIMSDSDYPPPLVDKSLRLKLISSPNPLIIERALFIFGIRCKNSDLCEEFIEKALNDTDPPAPVLSAIILSLYSCHCTITRLGELTRAMSRALRREDIVRDIGFLVIGMILMMNGRINRTEFESFISRTDQPNKDCIDLVREFMFTDY